MGKRGPKPTPTAILKMRGSWRGEQNKAEPQPEKGEPDMPTNLAEAAKAAWEQLVPMLQATGVLTRLDGFALARYCQLWCRWWELDHIVARLGVTQPIYNTDGKPVGVAPRNELKELRSLSLVLSRLEAEFGMTPSARSRISVPEPEESKPDKERYFA